MTRRGALTIATTIVLALLSLLVYSLDRTSWLLAQYELSQPDTLAQWLGLSPLTLGVAAALVIEVGAVALVAGDVLALERSAIKRYATAGLAVVLSVQALANLLAGFLRGYASMQATLVAHGATADVAWWVAGLAWVLSSAAVPALIFILSKLAAHVVRLALSAPRIAATATTDQRSIGAQERSGIPSKQAMLRRPIVRLQRSRIRRAYRHTGVVYLIRCGVYCKIGISRNVEQRLRSFQTDNPAPIEVIHLMRSSNIERAEAYLHYRFKAYNYRNEWFTLSAEQVAWIKAIDDIDVNAQEWGFINDEQPVISNEQTMLNTLLAAQATRYQCDHCGGELASKQAKGNATRYGCSNIACPGRSNRKGVRNIL